MFFFSFNVNAQFYLAEDIVNKTCLVESFEDSLKMGSGFFIQSEDQAMYFCTASHVLMKQSELGKLTSNLKKDKITIRYISSSGELGKYCFDISSAQKNSNLKIDTVNDIVIFKVSDIILKATSGDRKTYTSIFSPWTISITDVSSQTFNRNQALLYDSVLISSVIYSVGYPTALVINGNQIDFDYPLIKRGIIAGKNRKLRTIILDCDTHYGNSGGPVFAVDGNEIKIIGIMTKKLFYETKDYAKDKNGKWTELENLSVIGNSGYSVVAPYDFIESLLEEF